MKYLLVALMAIMAFACQKSEQKQTVQELAYEIEEEPGSENQLEKNATDSSVDNYKGAPAVPQPGSPEWDRKIIKIANVSLELKDYHTFNNNIHQNLRSFGAYVAQEQQTQSEAEISNNVTIKDDVIRVQNEISSITEDIEAASGRVQYMSHQSAYSTINLKYFQVLNAAKVDDKSPTFFTSFAESFKRGASFIGELLLFFVSIWPLLIGGAVAWYFIRKKVLKPKPQQVS